MGEHRILWIDCLKGIGILSVMFVHITGRKELFAYAIPMFFVLSGYLFHKQPVANYVLKTTRRMVVPYLVFLLLISLLIYGKEITVMGGGILMGGVGLTRELGTFWFPGVLFISLMIFNLLKDGIIVWVCIATFIVANLLNRQQLYLPLNFQAVAISLFYMTVGNIIREYLPIGELGRVVDDKIKLTTMCVAVCVGVAIIFIPGVYLDIKYNNYGIPVLSILLSVVMVAIIAVVSVKIAKVPVIGTTLAYCGKASLFIMFVHQYIHFQIFADNGRLVTLMGTIVLSLLLYYVAMQWRVTKMLLCGETYK
ncbi:MAG: acyltransferase family protein [Bacteroidales bacterium]|nr:acyltransferase family protein [Bacteroidales bacterium]